ncbi:MAG: PilZ domain-containing protein [Myxococcales bacterium]
MVRHPVQIPIQISVGREMAIHVTHDLSGKGAFFSHAIPWAVGTRVQLGIELPGQQPPIACDGEVVNVPDRTSFGMGLRFIGLSSEDERRIEQFAASCARR